LHAHAVGKGDFLTLPHLPLHVAEDGSETLICLHLVFYGFKSFYSPLLIKTKGEGVTEQPQTGPQNETLFQNGRLPRIAEAQIDPPRVAGVESLDDVCMERRRRLCVTMFKQTLVRHPRVPVACGGLTGEDHLHEVRGQSGDANARWIDRERLQV
jgi:hypothetical protein